MDTVMRMVCDLCMNVLCGDVVAMMGMQVCTVSEQSEKM